ncbi:hypothetical protein [Rhizobium sp. BR 314]|uniref:hypothetical protein n=1 Tax=Rhizobium sp. BR 314 TaxID=3040013 RepID=UPI0039BF9111
MSIMETRGSIAMTITSNNESSSPVVTSEFAGREQLRASSTEFRKEVIEVSDGVFVAVGGGVFFCGCRPLCKKFFHRLKV